MRAVGSFDSLQMNTKLNLQMSACKLSVKIEKRVLWFLQTDHSMLHKHTTQAMQLYKRKRAGNGNYELTWSGLTFEDCFL